MMKLADVRNSFVGFALLSASIYFSPSVCATAYTWTPSVAGTYDWNTTAQDNWGTGVAGAFPNAIDDVANMDTLNLTGTQTINLGGQSITLGELHLGDTVGGSGASFAQNFAAGAGNGLVFQKSSGNAKFTYGNPNFDLRTSLNINVPVTLNSDTEVTVALQSSNSRNLYFNTGALSGSGNMILGAATRGIVAFFTDTYDMSAYTGTIKFTDNVGGNGLQFAGNNLGTGNFRQATLEMSDLTGGTGQGVFVFDAKDQSQLELGALRGTGLLRPFTNLDGSIVITSTLRTGYLPGTNDFSGVISPTARFAGSGAPVNFNYEKVGASSTQIFSGANIYTGTTTVSEGKLLVNGSHTFGDAYTVASGATLGGTGSIDSIITVNSGGILAPGASVGTLTALKDVTLASGSHLAIELSGASADQLVVGGSSLDLTGAVLDVTGAGSGSSWVIASYLNGGLTGTFGTVPSGYTVNYGTGANSQITLNSACAPGDLNCDGHIDAQDYVFWRKTNGPGANYTAWRAVFGSPSGSGSGLVGGGAVPEPTALLLMVTAIIGGFIPRQRR